MDLEQHGIIGKSHKPTNGHIFKPSKAGGYEPWQWNVQIIHKYYGHPYWRTGSYDVPLRQYKKGIYLIAGE